MANFTKNERPGSLASRMILALIFLGILMCGQLLSAQGYSDLYDFPAHSGGCCPQHPSIMAEGRDGNLYGITSSGGNGNIGTIFKITPSGRYTQLYSFDTVHGSTPVGGLLLGLDGNLYGTTEEGGAYGFGNIFRISPTGALTVIHDFTGNSTTDGGFPVSALIIGSDGAMYGTTHPGIVYRITQAGVFTRIATTPSESFGPLLLSSGGAYYGTTEFAGATQNGSIYKVTGSTSTILYSFDGPHGQFPIGGLVEGSDGNLYGTTTAGGTENAGVIYKITPTGTYTVLYNFSSKNYLFGYQAFAGLIAGSDGNLYGATIWGGTSGYGVIFEITTAGAYSVLTSFDAPDGDGAYATPMQHTNGAIFGLAKRGGLLGNGVVYGFNAALRSFALLTNTHGLVGGTVGILGTGFATASSVTFNGTPASFHVISNTYLTATIPSGETGFIAVTTSSGTLFSSKIFKVAPQVPHFSPPSGKVGDSVVLTGAGLIQTQSIGVGGVRVTSYTVNSDSQVTFTVPNGAKTGKIAVITPGGSAQSTTIFTVTQ
jgi:uncharacterized repeat protein (TIGR03803 family)